MEKQDEIGGDTAKAMHTPGPWKLKFTNNVVGANDRLVANCGSYSTNMGGGAHHAENDANTRLIAAAPDLLKSAQRFVAWFDEHHAGEYESEMVRSFRAAIAKASDQQ